MFAAAPRAFEVPRLLLADVPPWLPRSFAVALGLLVGSFLNVVIARVPKGESIVSPPSHCACGKPIAPYDNIPVLSWLMLRGHARCCGAKISARYPLVELIGGLVAFAIVERLIFSAPIDTPLGPLAARAFADFAIAMALIAAAFIDLDHMYLPNPITLGGTAFALGTSVLRPEVGLAKSAVGLAVGFLSLYSITVLYKWVRGRHGMGLGDAKLQMLFGAWFGWEAIIFTLFAGSFQGVIAAVVIYAKHGKIPEPEMVTKEREEAEAAGEPLDEDEDPVARPPEAGLGAARLPFGPFLILGAFEYMLFGRWFFQRFLGLGGE